jgi:hypothetical protein
MKYNEILKCSEEKERHGEGKRESRKRTKKSRRDV